jgi:hypothetical protein
MLVCVTASLNEVQKQQSEVYLGFGAASEPVIVGLRLFLLKVMQVQYPPQAKNLVEHEKLAFSLMRNLKCHSLLKIFDKVQKDEYPCVSLYTVTQEQVDEAYSEYYN